MYCDALSLQRMSSFWYQASLPKGSASLILDSSSSLLLFSAAMNIAGVSTEASSTHHQGETAISISSSSQQPCESLPVLISQIAAALDLRSCGTNSSDGSGRGPDDAVSTSGLEAALIIVFNSLNDSEREKVISELTHSMVFVLIQAAGASHGLQLLQRFALMALAGISMSASGRRLVLNEAHPPVPAMMDVLRGGELHSAALAALVLGNLALEPSALAALDQCPVVFAREIVSLMSSEQVRVSQHFLW
jgi:hypothetical protein